jgi:energy-coupling factor transporter ATP-binding protein EcfA2
MKHRDELLHALEKIGQWGAKAETLDQETLLHATLPTQALKLIHDPEILLIVGGRGAGKTHLFRLLNILEAREIHLEEMILRQREQDRWLTGFSTLTDAGQRFPTSSTLHALAKDRTRAELVYFWRGLLAHVLLRKRDEAFLAPFHATLQDALSAQAFKTLSQDVFKINHIWDLTQSSNVSAAMDQAFYKLDASLKSSGQEQYLFITYDDLDHLALDWEQGRKLIQSLFQFWMEQWRILHYIRPKIFIRQDLWAPEFLDFPDASKFNAHRIVLTWTPRLLYQLVFKAWANVPEPLGKAVRDFLDHHLQIRFSQGALGWMYEDYPRHPNEGELQAVMHALVGPYMGSGPTKGRSYNWPPNHLQDAKGDLYPRSMLLLFSKAASDELSYGRGREDPAYLLTPTSFRQAMTEVSKQRLLELEEEYPWIKRLKPHLQDKLVPMPQSEMEELLKEISWEEASSRETPPHTAPRQLIAYMLSIGVLRRTNDGRLHVPDIYLYGFELKRKGGIRKPREELQF